MGINLRQMLIEQQLQILFSNHYNLISVAGQDSATTMKKAVAATNLSIDFLEQFVPLSGTALADYSKDDLNAKFSTTADVIRRMREELARINN